MRFTAGAFAWRKVEGMLGDRCISRKSKTNVFTSWVTPAYMTALEPMTLTEKQQEKVQVCENNLVRRIDGVKREDKRIDELEVEF